MNTDLVLFVTQQYRGLNEVLGQAIASLGNDDKEVIDQSKQAIKTFTNHHGLHLTSSDLYLIFLGVGPA